MTFEREVARRQLRATDQLAEHRWGEAARRDERRLHPDHLDLVERICGRIDEDGCAVRPRWFAFLAGAYVHGLARDGAGVQTQPFDAGDRVGLAHRANLTFVL